MNVQEKKSRYLFCDFIKLGFVFYFLVCYSLNTVCFADSVQKSAVHTSSKAQNQVKSSTGLKTDSKAPPATLSTGKSVAAPVLPKKATGSGTPQKPEIKKGDKLFLYKISSSDGAVLYALGTIHLFRPEYYPLPEELEKAFRKSRALLVEVDITKSDPNLTKQFVAEKGVYARGDSMTRHVRQETLDALKAYCSKSEAPLPMLLQMKPWLAALTLTQMEMQRLGYSNKLGIDLHFINKAHASAKKVIGLETEEFQLNLFASLAAELQEQMLQLSIAEMNDLETEAGKMMQAWWRGDAEKMYELVSKDVREHPEFAPVQEKLLYERNETMSNKLEAYLKGGNDTFMLAVGSGHLVGDRSILELLKKKGYSVSQVLSGDDI